MLLPVYGIRAIILRRCIVVVCVAEVNAMARKGISYSRFSRDRQGYGDSQRRQDTMALEAARAEGVEIDPTLTLRDPGVSAFRGRNWKRGDLGKFLDLVDAGLIPKGSVLIIEQVNRLCRMPWMDAVELWKEILSRGIIIRTCAPAARYTRKNMDELSVGCPVVIFMMIAHQESKQKSDWLRQVWAQKKKRARQDGSEPDTKAHVPHGRSCPEWLEPICEVHPKDPERMVTLRYEMIEERRALVEQVYLWALAGWGAMRILTELNDKHLPAWNRAALVHAREHGGTPRWRLGWVKHLLHARSVLGEYQPLAVTDKGTVHDGDTVPDYYPRAIDDGLFSAVQAAKRARRRTGGRKGVDGMDTNLFTGLVFESVSRRPMSVHNSQRAGLRYRTLATDPPTARLSYPAFERAALRTVADLRACDVDGRHQADALTAEVDRLTDERTRLGLELDDLDRQINELPREKWPRRVVARMADLQELIDVKDEEFRIANEKANSSGRTAALTAVQTALRVLDDATGTPREPEVREQIKTRLGLLLESIWVVVQPVNKMCRIVHVRLYLHGGEERAFRIKIGSPKKGWPATWPLGAVDFRRQDVLRDALDSLRAAT